MAQFVKKDDNRDEKVGTEEGVKEPRVTFSANFGVAFIMLHPTKYAAMLATKMEKHGATRWLVNTGWSGGSYGPGSRMKLAYTRKIIDANLDNDVSSMQMQMGWL
ncbi:hypothetical protein SSX86_020236 [Deinandra increscens subsp. villosa]|uniref:Phosphoenolpyruvate carboxykinase n=1 Tax=Deinandra increscens subsp. villosa TaxID=3103831 RepID=A0AAP0GT16_9ASTR